MNKLGSIFNDKFIKISFIMCGDPDLENTAKAIKEAIDSGVSMIELGIPFSDPTCEDDKTKEANLRALSNGISTDKIFEFLTSMKNEIKIPIIFATYANVIYSYNSKEFMRKCKEVNVYGLIIKDLPYEEKEEFLDVCSEYDIKIIPTIAKTSKERLSVILDDVDSFIKLDLDLCDVTDYIKIVKEIKDLPCVINVAKDSAYQEIVNVVDGVVII